MTDGQLLMGEFMNNLPMDAHESDEHVFLQCHVHLPEDFGMVIRC